MKFRTVVLGIGLAAGAMAEPRIEQRGVRNAASFITDGLPNGGIAQGSIFAIFGEDLGPQQLVQAPRLPLETQLAGVQVEVISGGVTYAAFLLYAVSSQVSAVLPSAVPAGPAEFRVIYNGVSSNRVTAQVRQTALGVFTQSATGSGPAVVQNWVSPTVAPRLNGLRQGILPGDIAILWATGLGPVSGGDSAPAPVGDLPVDVEVFVGGLQARVLYKGRSASYPGVDQINFEIPAGIGGCYVPLAVRAGGVLSNFASISVVAGGTLCGDSVSFRGPLLAAAGAHPDIRVGMVELLHEEYSFPASATVFWAERVRQRFFAVPWGDLNLFPRLADYQVAPGTCTVIMNPWEEAEDYENVYPSLPSPSYALPRGASQTLQGPAGSKVLESEDTRVGGMEEPGGVAQPKFFVPGTFVWEDAEPPEPPRRRSSLQLLGEIQWTNKAALTNIDRSAGLTFTWTGGLDNRDYVLLSGSAADEALKTRVTFVCAAQPSAGSFTVPSYVLSALPVNTANPGDRPPYGFLAVGTSSTNTLPQSEAGNLHMLYLRYLFRYISLVDFR